MGRQIVEMTGSLVHRGPDDFGYIALDPGSNTFPIPLELHKTPAGAHSLFFGHRRLSIIDISGTKQPLANEDKSVWVIFNGEIYNYDELGKMLVAKGHILREKGDTEVLVHLWEEYGAAMPEHLVGMFAFAVYDSKKNVLFLARDRFGEKPLYYFEKDGRFFFASELQAFFHLDEFDPNDVNELAIALYFRYGFIPGPNTAYKNVFSLGAGRTLLKTSGNSEHRYYWKPSVSGEMRNPDFKEIEELIDESVRLRLRSDVPLGAFLSGGIDSGLITASMSRQLDKPVSTFTISTDKNSWQDESEAAKLTASHLKTFHREIKVEPDFVGVTEKLARHYGQPLADHSSVLTYYVSRETRKYVKVALTGDGGDELFGGYGSYLNLPLYQLLGGIPYPFKKFLAGILRHIPFSPSPGRTGFSEALLSAFSLPEKGENTASLFHRNRRDSIFQSKFKEKIREASQSELNLFTKYFNEANSDDPVDRWMEVDQRLYLCYDILAKLDIASMSVSLECRPPFLDHRLAKFANSISAKAKLRNGQSKYMLRQLAREQFPAGLASLPKKGFSMPLAEWLRQGQLKEWIYSLIFENKNSWNNYLREDSVENLWKEHQAGKMNHQMRLWMIASLVLWQKTVKIR
jgi:asparagine synthase (glutamine-hydrolysing)